MSDLPDPAQEIRDLREENQRLKENNNLLAKIAHDFRGALQSIADGIGDQETAENALHRLTSRGIDGLDVDPSKVGIKGRIEELEAENERLRGKITKIRTWLANTPGYRRGKHWEEAMWHTNDALNETTTDSKET